MSNLPTIDHIAIIVDDLEEAKSWYIKNVGGKIIHEESGYYRLKVSNISIALVSGENKRAHFGIISNLSDLPKGSPRVHHRDGTIGTYVSDPWGNYIEFIYYDDECKKKFSIDNKSKKRNDIEELYAIYGGD